METGVETKSDTTFTMPAPVWIRSVYINGYYVFNGRRYSQAAAYNSRSSSVAPQAHFS